MSRIWKNPIVLPKGVEYKIDKNTINVKWKNWELNYTYPDWVVVEWDEKQLTVSIKENKFRNYWGLVRTLISNMVEWVSNWFKKELLILWVWYNAKVQWDKLILSLGFSHSIEYQAPKGIKLSTYQTSKWNIVIVVEWADKQQVWEVSAIIRSYRKPEPYKGKWIRYIDEQVKIKEWKTASK